MATSNGEKSLESWIWDAACSSRGAKDAAKYKEFILPLIFTKRLCDDGRHCVLVLGDTYSRSYSRSYQMKLPDAIATIATEEVGGYKLLLKYNEEIPDARRVRRGLSRNLRETTLVLQRR